MKIYSIFIFCLGTLPESPPDSGSEPPYSPTDLHAISNLNQMQYQQHNYPTNSQPANPHQLDQAMHVNETSGVDCHTANLVNGNNNNSSSIHKTEDIMLSSAAAMPLSSMMPGNDMMMHQNVRHTCIDIHNLIFISNGSTSYITNRLYLQTAYKGGLSNPY